MTLRTLRSPVVLSGVGLHTGAAVSMRCLPAPAGSGIVFVRTDRPGTPPVRAAVEAVSDAARSVTLGPPPGIRTVEHLLAAAAALGVSDLRVEVDGAELPALDGSAGPIAEGMRAAELVDLEGTQTTHRLRTSVWVSDGDASLLALPARELRMTYVVPLRSPALGTQVVDVHAGELSRLLDARTWGYVDELKALRTAGLARGAGPDNALGIDPSGYVTAPRGPDEPARHKALDLLGDLSLIGGPLQAHVIAVAAGHRLHLALVRAVLDTEEAACWNWTVRRSSGSSRIVRRSSSSTGLPRSSLTAASWAPWT
jgi:UDP-3-O-acyl N-acetylglucosamine deacetylase